MRCGSSVNIRSSKTKISPRHSHTPRHSPMTASSTYGVWGETLTGSGATKTACLWFWVFGYEVDHVGDLGIARAEDSEILIRARDTGAVIITLDADFHALLARNASMGPSVVRLRVQGVRSEQLCALIQAVLESCAEPLAGGAVVSANDEAARVRRLPIA